MINSAITLKSTATLLISLTLIQFLQLTRVRTLTADIDQSLIIAQLSGNVMWLVERSTQLANIQQQPGRKKKKKAHLVDIV